MRAAVVEQTASGSYIQRIASDHRDSDSPATQHDGSVADNTQNDRVSTAPSHVNVEVESGVLTAKDREPFADGGSDHERIRDALPVLIGLSERELEEVESELTDILLLLDSNLTGVSSVLAVGIVGIDEFCFVVGCGLAASE